MNNITSFPDASINGVHHTARPTWKLRETVEFYRDKLGLPLVHAITAKGWPEGHPDFLHFFFDSGNGSTIAFFYYLGTEQPDNVKPFNSHFSRATHTAWKVNQLEELSNWKKRLEAVGIPLRYETRHEVIESIYFSDPNGYPLEITYQLRPFSEKDINDAQLTLDTAMELEDLMLSGSGNDSFADIEDLWTRKGKSLLHEFEDMV